MMNSTRLGIPMDVVIESLHGGVLRSCCVVSCRAYISTAQARMAVPSFRCRAAWAARGTRPSYRYNRRWLLLRRCYYPSIHLVT
jgi:hypothetical protein